MLSFPIRTLNTIKRLLLRQQREVEESLEEVGSDDPAKTPSLIESSEPGTDSYIADSHNKIQVLQNNLRQVSINIKKALTKIRTGKYGLCENCGERIEIGRLLAMPTATLCLTCSKKAGR